MCDAVTKDLLEEMQACVVLNACGTLDFKSIGGVLVGNTFNHTKGVYHLRVMMVTITIRTLD